MSASRTNNNRKRRRHGVDDNKSLYSPGTSLRQYFGEQMHMSSPYKPPRIDRPIHTYCNSNDPTLINLHVCGIPIKLPVKPYRSQMAMFDRIMKGLVRQQNCLIESPTGTGKTLALLSAALAWLETERERTLQESLSRKASCPVHSFPATIVDTQSTPVSSQDDPDEAFVSRHTPLSALKKFAYDPSFVSTSPQCTCSEPERMTILGSRENSCINPHVAGGPDKIQKCHELRIDGMGCSNYNNLKKDYDKPRSIRQLFNDVEDPVWDIEDLVSMAKSQHHKFCPYFAATRVLTKDAKLVLCPYNYLVDPQIRKSMEINLSGNVVILDEAHNIEDSCRDAASFTLSLGEMEEGYSNFVEIERVSKEIRPFVTQPDSQQMYDEFIVCYDKLSHLCKNLIEWLCRMADDKHVNDRRNDELCGVWNGPAIHAVMNDSDLPLKKEERMEFSAMLAKIAKPDLDDNPHERSSFQSDNTQEGRRDEKKRIPKPLSKSLAVVEKLLLFLDYFDNHENDYKMCITKKIAQYGRTVTKPIRDEDGYLGKEKREKSDEITVHWWCMSPAVSFRDAVSEARSVILASGTLSPLDTFKSELGIEFQLTMEGAHVIPKEQIYAATVATGPSGYNLRTVYKESVLPEFQDEVGQLILQICRTVCSGVLCFLPSYRLLDAFTNRWRETGLWDDISSLKFIAEEPRFSSDLHSVMENFYSAIKQPSLFGSSCTGALFLAICRGKVSEGLDFNDENARAVITVGIPYPNVKDMQVESKRKFNDDNCQKLGLLSGKQWYEIQAFRALNQALGRCLRHKNDWGALILVDARFSENPSYYCGGLSRWIRENLVCRHYGEFASDLSNFVDRMVMIEKDKNPPSTSESQQSSESSGQESPVFGSSCETTTD